MDYDLIRSVVEEYQKSIIQSEAEVSTKLIYPLFKALGYPDECMAQEFPVYGYGGRTPLDAKAADFLYFKDYSFASHRTNTQANKEWVHDNSLLIVEAKKPGKLLEDKGQAQFYTAWTKSIAYVETDGIEFRAYYYSSIHSDFEIINTTVDKLHNEDSLRYLTYEALMRVKNDSNRKYEKELATAEDDDFVIITRDEDLHLPDEIIAFYRKCLGKNSSGLSNVQVVARFLNMTDSYLANDMRYGIPEYMIDFPRRAYKARLYIDNSVFPIITGEVTEYYWNEESRYLFESDYIVVGVRLISDQVVSYEVGYHVLDKTVDERINSFQLVKKVLDSDKMTIQIDNSSSMRIALPESNSSDMWISKKYVTEMFNFWYSGMEKLKAIEEYYDIKFNLKYVSGEQELNQLYNAIDFVYDGINLQENCVVTVAANLVKEDMEIEYPIFFEENEEIPLRTLVIQGVEFKPYRSSLLPCTIKRQKKGIIRIPACCEYRVVK